jgi:hypothetical protein
METKDIEKLISNFGNQIKGTPHAIMIFSDEKILHTDFGCTKEEFGDMLLNLYIGNRNVRGVLEVVSHIIVNHKDEIIYKHYEDPEDNQFLN